MFKYPKTRKEEVIEDHFGVQVEDSYRWMEDESHPDLGQWIDAQNALTQDHLSDFEGREAIKARLEALNDYKKCEMVRVIGDKVIYLYNDGLQDQSVYYIQEGLDGQPKVLVDPNKLSEDGTVAVSLNGHSKDKRYLSYLQAGAGSDWHVIKIIDLETLELLEDTIEWVKFTYVAWQDKGFYYSAFDAPEDGKVLSQKNEDMKVYYHELGTSQDQDRLIFADSENPLRYHSLYTSKDEKSMILHSGGGTYGGEVYVKTPSVHDDFQVVFPGLDTEQHYLGSSGDYLYFTSDENAPNGQVIRVHATSLDQEVIIKEDASYLSDVNICKDYILAKYLVDCKDVVRIHDLKGTYIKDLDLPSIGTAYSFTSSDDMDEIIYGFTSFLEPAGFYTYNMETSTSQAFKVVDLPYDVADYVTEQIFTKSKDGTQVPSFLIYKKGLKLDGSNPTLLYAYGGFNVSLTPFYNPSRLYLLDQGCVYVQANLRGGSEYGEDWHKAGMLFNKQNVFDDFIAVGEDLIQRGYTSKDKLAIHGGSNGGLLIGAVVNQRPDLFKVAFPAVGVMDMLRYHKFTIGWGWVGEYGSPDEEDHFHNIYKYSPLHNIEKKAYPATMVMTADHDDRVVPAHSFKYLARLQEMNTSDQPMLIRINKDAGHGAGMSMSKMIDQAVDQYAFFLHHTK